MKMAGSNPGHFLFVVPAKGASVLFSVLVGLELEDAGAIPHR
jgi:hypothetical protein